MSNRKSTPDILGEILGTPPAPAESGRKVSLSIAERNQPAAAVDKPARARKPRSEASIVARVEWEYMTVLLDDHKGLRPRMINENELENWKCQPLLRDFLSIVGGYGWELVCIVDLRRNQKEAYFKRPKAP